MFPDASVGRRHFEANQDFSKYPELMRILQNHTRCKPYLINYQGQNNTSLPGFETISEEDRANHFVNLAAKTFTSQIRKWRISHEKTGEQLTLSRKYGMPIHKTRDFGKTDGVTETNNLLRGDYTQPHPFHLDEKVTDANGHETGLWKLGKPFLFFLVDDDQVESPRGDQGLKTFREHISGQRWTEEQISENDRATQRIPGKTLSDCGDALRMWACGYAMPSAKELTPQERVTSMLTDSQQEVLSKKNPTMGEQLALNEAVKEASRKVKKMIDPNLNSLGGTVPDDYDLDSLGFKI
jgi:hypothetical protein